MTERTVLVQLHTLQLLNGVPYKWGTSHLHPRPAWATALVYGTNGRNRIRWAARPVSNDVLMGLGSMDALSGERRDINYTSNTGWRNVWIKPEVVEAPAHPAVFYACVVEDVDTPYGTLEEAKASAERHAKANPGTRVTVMQEHGVVVAATKLDWS